MIPLEPSLVSYLLNLCSMHTKSKILQDYALSYNTLRKIEAGLPLRRSLALRLENRLRGELNRG